jgi:hypothetical protein
MLAIASSSEIPTFVTGRDSIQPLFDAQMTREIFASIDSATRPGSESLLLSVPAAVILMLNTEGLEYYPPNFSGSGSCTPQTSPFVVTSGLNTSDPSECLLKRGQLVGDREEKAKRS